MVALGAPALAGGVTEDLDHGTRSEPLCDGLQPGYQRSLDHPHVGAVQLATRGGGGFARTESHRCTYRMGKSK